MDLEKQFHERIAAIHGLNRMNAIDENPGPTRDTRHEEFQAMADVFLGSDYDRVRLERVESLQVTLDRDHASLLRRLDAGELSPEEYVEAFNGKLSSMFEWIEKTLGADDFVKLFGAPPNELGGFIDKETFLQSRQPGEQSKPR